MRSSQGPQSPSKTRPASDPGSRLSPADHVALLVELLQSSTPDQARRWLHALLRVPASEREALVETFERRVLAEYGDRAGRDGNDETTLQLRYPPEQREGYVEERIVEYARAVPERVKKTSKQPKIKRASRSG